MQIAIVLYPGFTALDVIGPAEVLGRLPGVEVAYVAEQTGFVVNDLENLAVNVTKSLADVPTPDIVLVGGGPGQMTQMDDGPLHVWLRDVDQQSTWTASVCTGTLILAAAGVLKGRKATTHWGALPLLAEYGVSPAHERVVIDGKNISGAGVSAGIDMALVLAGVIAGDTTAQAVQLILEYAPEPPFQSGSPDTAPRDVLDLVAAWESECEAVMA